MTHKFVRANWRVAAVVAGLGLSGCGSTGIDLGNIFGGASTASGVAAPSVDRPEPNEKGVIKYPTYAVVVAKEGDTLAKISERVSVQPDVLSKLNGLPSNYITRPGEMLVLPKGASLGEGEEWTAGLVENAIDRAPQGTANAAKSNSADGPLRHTVEAGETAYSIARLYDVSVTSLASWNGLDANLSVTPGRTLIVPVTLPKPANEAVAEPGTASAVTAPPSAAAPLPKNVDVAALPDSPGLAKDRTPVGVQRKLAYPVAGKIVKGFSLARGSAKNEGIDFETKADAVVKAAEAGEVALVSPSLDRDGKILLIRHADELITVYTDIDQIPFKKGDKVKRGQKIGVVANASKPRLHFEVRRGVEPVDPLIYLQQR